MMVGRGTPEGPRKGESAVGGPARHIPVLLCEVVAALGPKDGAVYVDATFGAGGYSRALLEKADCRVVALDRDPSAIALGSAMVAEFADRLTLVEGQFSKLEDHLLTLGLTSGDIAGIVFDIGVSSMQLDQAGRGFSFRQNGPLDMRMSSAGETAADLVNSLDQAALADILWLYGEERRSRAIARAIVHSRQQRRIETTGELADLVVSVLGPKRGDERHPATRTFQALRIAVNDELAELVAGLAAGERLLAPGGRMAVVTFHSLEDRIVKRFFAKRTGRAPKLSRHLPQAEQGEPSFRIVNPRPVSPRAEEIRVNPRCRSARLRYAERTEATPLPIERAELAVPEAAIGKRRK